MRACPPQAEQGETIALLCRSTHNKTNFDYFLLSIQICIAPPRKSDYYLVMSFLPVSGNKQADNHQITATSFIRQIALLTGLILYFFQASPAQAQCGVLCQDCKIECASYWNPIIAALENANYGCRADALGRYYDCNNFANSVWWVCVLLGIPEEDCTNQEQSMLSQCQQSLLTEIGICNTQYQDQIGNAYASRASCISGCNSIQDPDPHGDDPGYIIPFNPSIRPPKGNLSFSPEITSDLLSRRFSDQCQAETFWRTL